MAEVIKAGRQFRSLSLRGTAVDQEARTVELAFASEVPYERHWGIEVLQIRDGAIRLDRLRTGGPLLMDHNPIDQVGVVEAVRVGTDRIARATVRFGRGARAQEVFQDVVDGIRTHVSVGYRIHEMELDSEKDGVPTYRVTDWEPFEVSITSTPLDPTVGVGRTAVQDLHDIIVRGPAPQGINTMIDTDTAGQAGTAAPASRASITAERERVADITAIAQRWNADPQLVQRAIGEGWAPDRLGRLVLQGIAERQAPATPGGGFETGIGLSTREVRGYSVLRAIRAIAEGNPQLAPLEMEASRTLARQLGREPRGFFVPYEVQKRDLTAASTTQGARLVGTEHRPQDFVELLRARLVVMQLGARRMSGLVGNVSIPRQTGAGTAYWLANEATAITEGDQTIGQILMSPKNVGAYTEISKQLTTQSTPDAEAMVMDDLARVVAIAIDTAALNGTGATGQPLGLIGTAGIGAVTGTSLAYAGIQEFQTDVAASNALVAGCAYLTTPAVASLLMQRQRFTSTDSPLWMGSVLDGTVSGFRATSSTLVPAATMIFGDFSQIILAEWGVMELEVNPYANFPAGIIGVRAWASVDIAIRQAGAFSVAATIT
jgi:HK97 family phage major capsid protein